MNLQSSFKQLLINTKLESNDVINTLKAITKKLNSIYYDLDDDTKHMIFAGSFGRGTANIYSDVDYCFVLPKDVFYRFEKRKGNVQSQLISEIKENISERYPNTIIKGDGQVVDVKFNKRLVELVPCFILNDSEETLIYPDTHRDGNWKKTNPKSQNTIVNEITNTYPLYKDLCKLLRCWKMQCNVKIKGIVIDCAVKMFLEQNYFLKGAVIDNIDIIKILIRLFDFMSYNLPDSIKIIGENEFVETGKGNFKRKCEKAVKKLEEDDFYKLWDNCISIFGTKFPKNPSENNVKSEEQFIGDIFRIHITNNVEIDCKISANGFRPIFLSKLLNLYSNKYVIEQSKSLDFEIVSCDVDKPYDTYWKIRNVGSEAIKRNMIRGKIFKGNDTHHECSQFHGTHYVECYIIKEGTCVAKTRLDVPII